MPLCVDLEKLEAISGRAVEIAAWRQFGLYLQLRARGLRRASLIAVRAFITEANGWELVRREAFIRWLADEAEAVWDQRLLIPHDLLVDLVAPSVRECLSHQPRSSLANYLSGKYCQGDDDDPPPLEAFRRSVALDPDFQPARRAFIDWVTGHAENHQHELPWHGYLADASEDVRDLIEARTLLSGVHHPLWRKSIGSEIDSLLEVARAWEQYARSGESDFAGWCRANDGPARFLAVHRQ